MLNKRGIMDDWLQVIFAIFIIGVSIPFFLGIKSNITNQINQYADDALERAEGARILLEYLSSVDDKGKKTIDLLALAIANNDYKYFEDYTNNFFKAHYKDPSKVAWMLRIEPIHSLEIKDKNFDSAGSKTRLASVKLSAPNGEILTISLNIGKDIGVT